jgi:Na+-transporting NADH:ubiquinone oxidoreductase subunit C
MKERLFSVVYMFGLTLLFTSAVSAVKHVNQERIERNEAVKLQSVILDALGISLPGSTMEIERLFAERVRKTSLAGRDVYVGYDAGAETVIGYAFDAGGPGFWGPIAAMAAVDGTGSRLLGVNFYRHSETPGLGARITEEGFRRQFRGLELDGRGESFFRLLPAGTAAGPGELDAVTGATETSRAVERFLNRELASFIAAAQAGLPESD